MFHTQRPIQKNNLGVEINVKEKLRAFFIEQPSFTKFLDNERIILCFFNILYTKERVICKTYFRSQDFNLGINLYVSKMGIPMSKLN